ncbi:uncharacterized protein LOC124420489 [Lucilia cuprina]|uniref:uncharacterized protein LOC124420489 n=1 Tax=Lucilia cuprina TaxID=7375 RepID=UPI001F0612A1|nr:uncharacterized protein LOC124420489 [Lucilia cuprina]
MNNYCIRDGNSTLHFKERGSSSTLRQIKSSTTLLCELTRLKTQQKYLECSEVKVNITNNIASSSTTLSNQCDSATHVANEIQQLQIQLEGELNAYLQQSRTTANDIYLKIKEINENMQSERLAEFSVSDLRNQISCVNSDIESLKLKNFNELSLLQKKL